MSSNKNSTSKTKIETNNLSKPLNYNVIFCSNFGLSFKPNLEIKNVNIVKNENFVIDNVKELTNDKILINALNDSNEISVSVF